MCHRRSVLQWCTYDEYVETRQELKLRIDKAVQSADDPHLAKKYKTGTLSLLTFFEDEITHAGVSKGT